MNKGALRGRPAAVRNRVSVDLYMSDFDTVASSSEHTKAFNDALAAAANLVAGGAGKVRILLDSRQKYTLSGPLVQGAHGEYAQVPLPYSKTISGTIELVGMEGFDSPYVGLGQSSTVIESTFTGAPTFSFAGAVTYGIASIFGGPSSYLKTFRAFGNFNYLYYGFRHITIRSAAPVICGIDAGYLNGFYFDDLTFDTDQIASFPGGASYTSSSVTACTALQAIPLITPLYQCYYGCHGGTLRVMGWTTGPVIGELANIRELLVNFVTGPAICLDVSAHASKIAVFKDWNNAYGVGAFYPASGVGTTTAGTTGNASQATFVNATPSQLQIDCWDAQRDGGASNALFGRVYDLYDASGIIPLQAVWARSSFSGGNPVEIGGFLVFGSGSSTLGATKARVVDKNRTPGVQTAPSVPTSTTVIRNPFLREALVQITGGTVTAINVNGTATGQTSGPVLLPSCGTISITYSSAPTWTWMVV